jgi:peptidyl-prolyl cis-trans isomerase A (cyclophilin A)
MEPCRNDRPASSPGVSDVHGQARTAPSLRVCFAGMQLLRTVCLVLTISACDHKNQRDDQAAGDLPTQPSPDPSPAARAKANGAGSGSGSGSALAALPDGSGIAGSGSGSAVAVAASGDMAVRAPVAADLELYTKDMKAGGKLTATFETTMGTIHCELFGDKSPITVANFVGLATGKKAFNDASHKPTKKPFFDGLTFHRVIPGFMIQGGDPEGSGRGGPGYEFQNEHADGLAMDAGMLAMANAGKDTNGSQFFITEVDRHELDPNYTIFGKCAETDIVKKITATPRDSSDKPNTPVVIKKVTIGKS